MNTDGFFARLHGHPLRAPALQDARSVLGYGALLGRVERLADALARRRVRTLATVLPNGIDWALADLAALRAGIVHVPLPQFFSASQLAFALAASGADAVLAADLPAGCMPEPLPGLAPSFARREPEPVARHEATRKITFTSGTTGTPKGVCLGADSMLATAESLAQALAPVALRRHLCALPLPVLLENLAGLYAPLAAGATAIVPAADEAGLAGSSRFNPAALNAAVARHGADSVIVLPQMLRAWASWRQAVRAAGLPTLKFVAVGGARVGRELLAQARRAGIPAYEGYGLSEAASVQTLNLPHADRPGSAGRPLPHTRLRIADDGEIWVSGSLMQGYVDFPPIDGQGWWPTGDLGHIDADGFLHIDGRRRNVLITAFGRNVSPEWVETELQAAPAIAQAVVFGEGQPALSAVLWPARPELTDEVLAAAVAAANARLPDYARVAHWVRAAQPFTAEARMATANGRPLREAIARAHAAALAAAAHLPEESDVLL